MKVVIDTNIWINRLINKEKRAFMLRLKRTDLQLFVSDDTIREIYRIGSREKFTGLFKPNQFPRLIASLLKICILQHKVPKKATFADPKDEFLLDLCLAARVDYLVTGDKSPARISEV